MAENRFDDPTLPSERRPLVVEGKRYYSKTGQICPTCGRALYLKMRLSGTAVLECPTCETVVHTPEAMVKMSE
jgi:predicted  nucleic acid-binding Zn ribbon protein